MRPPDLDPSVVERLSTQADHTDSTLDYAPDADIYLPSRIHVGTSASWWSLEPIRGQAVASISPLESEWRENDVFERRQGAMPSEVLAPAGFGDMRAIPATLPYISPEVGGSRLEEQRREGGSPLGLAMSPSSLGSAGVLMTELGEFSRTSRDPHMMQFFSPSDPDQYEVPFASTIPSVHFNPPPPYDEATDHLSPIHGQGGRRHLDEPHLYPRHAALDSPPHQRTHQTPRPLPTVPRRYDGGTTPTERVYLGPPQSIEDQSPLLLRQSKKLATSAASGTKQRRNGTLSPAQNTVQVLYHHDSASSESFHTCQQYDPHALDEHRNEHDITPRQSLGMIEQRPTAPIPGNAFPTESCSAPNRNPGSPMSSQTSLATTSVPSPPMLLTTLEGESTCIEGFQEAQPKQLSKMERALQRQAALGLKADSPQPPCS